MFPSVAPHYGYMGWEKVPNSTNKEKLDAARKVLGLLRAANRIANGVLDPGGFVSLQVRMAEIHTSRFVDELVDRDKGSN